MGKFKGTKGRWTRYTASIPSIDEPVKHSVYIGTTRIALCYNLFDDEIKVDTNEAPYNALLISKAPEMLEMLEQMVNDFHFGEGDKTPHWESWIQKARQLIKSSTEL